jgi:hypothetical protein
MPLKYLPYLGWLALVPVLGWFWIIFIGSRDTGVEVNGEKIWWKDLRWIHMLMYLLFAVLAISKNPNAWLVLLADVTFGLLVWLAHNFIR